MLLIAAHHPAARAAVKGAHSLCVHRSEAQTLDGYRSEGYAASAAPVPFATAQNSKLRQFCMIPFATTSVPNATLSGVECRLYPCEQRTLLCRCV
jgi:hypothetical protein